MGRHPSSDRNGQCRSREDQSRGNGVRKLPRAVVLGVTSCALTGCSFLGAPSFELFGAYFPGWMLCSLIGIVGAAGARIVLVTQAANDLIPLPLAACTAAGVIVALLSWMALFR